MSAAEILIILGTFIAGFVTGLSALEEKIIKKMKNKNAISADRAVKLEKLGFLYRWRIRRLTQFGVIKEVKPSALYF